MLTFRRGTNYPELYLGTHKNIKNNSNFDNQEIVVHFLGDIRMTRINSGFEC